MEVIVADNAGFCFGVKRAIKMANDTLDKVEAAALDQNVAAYAVFAYLAAESDVGFGSKYAPRQPPMGMPGAPKPTGKAK